MKRLFFTLSLAIGLSSTTWAQLSKDAEIRVKEIKVSLDAAPRYSLVGGQAPQADASRKWLVVEAYLESTPEWADEVTVRFYVVANYGPNAKDQPKDGYDVLTTVVTVVNMEKNFNKGKKNIVPVFLDASTVKKYENGNFQNFIPEVAVIVQYKGKLQDTHFMKNQNSGPFWNNVQPKSGLLLNLMQSPWSPAYNEYYEQVKPTGGAPSI